MRVEVHIVRECKTKRRDAEKSLYATFSHLVLIYVCWAFTLIIRKGKLFSVLVGGCKFVKESYIVFRE